MYYVRFKGDPKMYLKSPLGYANAPFAQAHPFLTYTDAAYFRDHQKFSAWREVVKCTWSIRWDGCLSATRLETLEEANTLAKTLSGWGVRGIKIVRFTRVVTRP